MIETCEAAPQRNMDLLQEVAAMIGVGLVGSRETFKRRAKIARRFFVKLVLRGPTGRNGFSRDHFALTAFSAYI